MESIKSLLMSECQASQTYAIKKINEELNHYDGKNLEDYIISLIRTGVGKVLCDILTVCNKNDFIGVLNCLDKLSRCKIFYTSSLAMIATAKISQLASFIAQNPRTNYSFLKFLVKFFADCSDRAKIFRVSFITESDIDLFLFLIKKLDIGNTSHPIEITHGSHLLCTVIQFINEKQINKELLEIIKQLYEDSLQGLSKIIPSNVGEDLLPICTSINIALKICIEGLRLNMNFNQDFSSHSGTSNTSDFEKFKLLQEITQFTFKIVVDFIIPNFRKIDEFCEKLASIESFIECLNLLFTFATVVDVQRLSCQLLIEKYLIYFLDMIQNSEDAPENSGCICKCVSNIITIQAELYLSINMWDDGPVGFKIFINDGLLSISTNPMTRYDSPYIYTLLFGYYFHYFYNFQFNIINVLHQIQLTKIIAEFSIDDPPQIPIIKVTWFFLSVSMKQLFTLRKMIEYDDKFVLALELILLVDSDIIYSDTYLADALGQIIELLAKFGVETCYVHHPKVLISVLRVSIFPNEIRHKVVELSLQTESPFTDICELVGVEYKDIIVVSLLNTLLVCKGITVERVAEELNKIRLKEDSNDFAITTLLWSTLPLLFSYYEKDFENNIEQYLKLLCESSSYELTDDMTMECSLKLIEILKRNDIEIKEDIECLIIILASTILSHVSKKNKTVVLLFIEDEHFVQKIYNEAIKSKNDDLTTASFICLASIVKCHIEFTIKSTNVLLINGSDVYNALIKSSVCHAALKFVNLIWMSEIEINSLFVNIRFNADEINSILPAIYQEILEHFGRIAPTEWRFMFSVLTNFLNFCRKNYPAVLKDCCSYPWTIKRIITTIKCKYNQKEFFEFAKVWLQYAIYINIGYVEEALYNKRFRKIGHTSMMSVELPFEVAVKNLNQYVHSLINAGKIKEKDVEELIKNISQII